VPQFLGSPLECFRISLFGVYKHEKTPAVLLDKVIWIDYPIGAPVGGFRILEIDLHILDEVRSKRGAKDDHVVAAFLVEDRLDQFVLHRRFKVFDEVELLRIGASGIGSGVVPTAFASESQSTFEVRIQNGRCER